MGKDACSLPGERGSINTVVASPDRKTVITAGYDRTVLPGTFPIWTRTRNLGKKHPYFVRLRDGELFVYVGVWDR